MRPAPRIRVLAATTVATLALLATGCSAGGEKKATATSTSAATTTTAAGTTAPTAAGTPSSSVPPTFVPPGVNDAQVPAGGSVNQAPPQPTIDAIAVGRWACPTLGLTVTFTPDKRFTVVVTSERGSANGTWALDAAGATASGDGISAQATRGENNSLVGNVTAGGESYPFSIVPTGPTTATLLLNGEVAACAKS